MATIKSYTDISQSKKLAEILPLESANVCYRILPGIKEGMPAQYIAIVPDDAFFESDIPAWSLAALLGVIKKYGLIDLRFLSSTFDGRGEHLMNVWCCTFDNINTVSFDFYADNPIDACYEVIIKLYELKML